VNYTCELKYDGASISLTYENGTIAYTEQVPEIVDEPNYKAALEALM